LKQVFSSVGEEMRFKRLMKRIYLEHSLAVMHQTDYRSLVAPKGSFVHETLSHSLLWADQFTHLLGGSSLLPAQTGNDMAAFFEDQPGRRQAAKVIEWFSGFSSLLTLVRKQLDLGRKLSHYSLPGHLKRLYYLGRFEKAARFFRRTLWLARAENDPEARKELTSWAESIQADLLEGLKQLSSSSGPNANDQALAETGALLKASLRTTEAFRRGEIRSCAARVSGR